MDPVCDWCSTPHAVGRLRLEVQPTGDEAECRLIHVPCCAPCASRMGQRQAWTPPPGYVPLDDKAREIIDLIRRDGWKIKGVHTRDSEAVADWLERELSGESNPEKAA